MKQRLWLKVTMSYVMLLFISLLPINNTFARSYKVVNFEAKDEFFVDKKRDFDDSKFLVVLDKYKSKVNDEQNELFEDFIEISTVNDLTYIDNQSEKLNFLEKEEFRQIFEVEVKNEFKYDIIHIMEKVLNNKGVLSVSPNYYEEVSEDIEYKNGESQSDFWGLYHYYGINASLAWDITRGSSNVKVAVMDTGIANHVDLNDSLVQGWDFYNNNNITNDDPTGHGTHVAGIIAGNNSGVAKNIKIVPLQVVNEVGGFPHSALISGITWCINNNIPILNYSGGTYNYSEGAKSYEYAISNYEGLFICAAGNNNNDNDNQGSGFYPSDNSSGKQFSDRIISVGSINKFGSKSEFSNYGKSKVSLFAPGDQILSTSFNNNYSLKNGTSMAAPFVAGVAALLLSKYDDLSASQLKEIIVESVVENISILNLCSSGGYLDAYRALKYAESSWEQPLWNSDINVHGRITSSGEYKNEFGWKAFNGTLNGGSEGNGDNWSVKSTTGWLELKLDYNVIVHSIEFFNGSSKLDNRTKKAKFVGSNNVMLGAEFTAPNYDKGRVYIAVDNILTNVIRLQVMESYGNYSNASLIKINATIPGKSPWIQPKWVSNSNADGQITSSGNYLNETAWKAYNGTMNGGSGGNGDNWSVKDTDGWLQLKLNNPIYIDYIEVWSNSSSGSNLSKNAYFSGSNGVKLGSNFKFEKKNQNYKKIYVGGILTDVVRLNITSSYGKYVGVSKIIITAKSGYY